jgi:sulfite reductase alpha subunit-like flavoprotein
MLLRIVAEQSGKGPEAAEAYIADLRRHNRYQRDVY